MTSRIHTQQTRELSSWRLQNKVAVDRRGERNRPPRGSSLRIFRLTMILFVTGGSLAAQQPNEMDPQQLVFKDDGKRFAETSLEITLKELTYDK